jgi:hypothetical protein
MVDGLVHHLILPTPPPPASNQREVMDEFIIRQYQQPQNLK